MLPFFRGMINIRCRRRNGAVCLPAVHGLYLVMDAESKKQIGNGQQMMDRQAIARQVIRNCDVSDARHAGLFSVCGLALRLRDLHKWEKNLPPWAEKEAAEVLEWIGDKEAQWEALAESDFRNLAILGAEYDPFDTAGVNAALEPWGLYYGAGYARSLKPSFFLAAIEEQTRVDGCPVFILGRELARDLLTLPALSQDDGVLLRREAALLHLWDQILYVKPSGKPALNYALRRFGLDGEDFTGIQRRLQDIYAAQKETYIYHELGEMQDEAFDRDIWREIIATYPGTPAELLARAVKDLLADASPRGTLRRMIATENDIALALYAAFFGGLGKTIFPELRPAFDRFVRTGRWSGVEAATSVGYDRAAEYAETMTRMYLDGKERGAAEQAGRDIVSALLKGASCPTEDE